MSDDDRTWHLSITTWAGISIGATHYYGRIHQPDPRLSRTYPQSDEEERRYGTIDVQRPMTADEAAALSAKDRFEWRAGELTSRFDTREDVIAAAVDVWRPIARERGGGRLLLGHPAYVEDMPVVAEEPTSAT